MRMVKADNESRYGMSPKHCYGLRRPEGDVAPVILHNAE